KAKLENRLDTRLKHYTKYKLLILDEIGYLPIDSEDAKLFFKLIDRRYENKSIILLTKSINKFWKDIFQVTMVVNAIVDRLLHHATVVNVVRYSYRLKDHIKKEE